MANEILEANFTPSDLNLRLMRRNHTSIDFNWENNNLTGYTNPIFIWAPVLRTPPAEKVPVVKIPGVIWGANPARISVSIDYAKWKTIPTEAKLGFYQLYITMPSGEPKFLIGGKTIIEESIWP